MAIEGQFYVCEMRTLAILPRPSKLRLTLKVTV
jgi:hypothetical protein